MDEAAITLLPLNVTSSPYRREPGDFLTTPIAKPKHLLTQPILRSQKDCADRAGIMMTGMFRRWPVGGFWQGA